MNRAPTIGISTFGGDGGLSGISQYIVNLLREMGQQESRLRYEVLVYEREKELFVPEASGMRPVCFDARLRNPLANIAWHQVALPRLCRERRYDVLFLPAGNRRLPLSVPCRTVGTVHDLASLHVDGKYDAARTLYATRVMPFLMRRLDHVVTVSASSKRDIVEHAGLPDERVSVIPLAANHAVYYPRERDAAVAATCRRYGIDAPFILYISRLEHPGKNHVRLVHAFEALKREEGLPHQLVLAGSDWVRAENVHRAALESPYAAEIVLTGFVPTEDLPYLYAGADLFVFPSLYEGFGLPVLESMASGVPVACSNISSLPEVAGDAALLFDPHDEDAMTEAMRRLLGEPALRAEMVRRGLARSRQYTWTRTADRTRELLERVAEG